MAVKFYHASQGSLCRQNDTQWGLSTFHETSCIHSTPGYPRVDHSIARYH